MKNVILSVICFFAVNSFLMAQPGNKKTDIFMVYGNCEMCQETIEGAMKKKDGIISKNWDPKTKMLTVTYDTSKIKLVQIKQKVADAGYDTDEVKAKDETYNKLQKCCRYERPGH